MSIYNIQIQWHFIGCIDVTKSKFSMELPIYINMNTYILYAYIFCLFYKKIDPNLKRHQQPKTLKYLSPLSGERYRVTARHHELSTV